jgi:hypothetical protein
MDNISSTRLKKGLSTIKKSINSHVGAVWSLKKNEVISKINTLGYKYNKNKNELTTNSMIRKKSRVKL